MQAKIEWTRTTAGCNLYNELCKTMHYDAALKEVWRRIEIRAEYVSNDTANVWTCVDGGTWVDEGRYIVDPIENVALLPEEDIPWDDDLADELAKSLKKW